MLAIHPNEFNTMDGAKAKLPVSVYEGITEGDLPVSDGAMQVDGSEAASLRFRSLRFIIDTDEAEMIAINYVAKGAGSAAAVTQAPQTAPKKSEEAQESSNKSSTEQKEAAPSKGPTLSPEEEDQIAGLTTRLNSIKMLQERLQVMSQLVESVPPSYLSDQTVSLSPDSPSTEHLAQLRNIQALLTRLSLLTPVGKAESESLAQAGRAQANDVALTSILSMLGQDIQGLSELGRKFMTVEQSKSAKSKSKGGFSQGGFGGLDDFNGRPSGLNPDSGLLMM